MSPSTPSPSATQGVLRARHAARPLAARGLLALLLALAAPAVLAQTERCVRTVPEFNAAMALSADQAVVIKMATGLWNMAGSEIDAANPARVASDESITLRGGYNSTCSSRSEDPGATVLTGAALDFSIYPKSDTLTLERLTLRAIASINLPADDLVTLDRVWLDQVGTTALHGPQVVLRSSLVTRSGGHDGFYSDCAVWANAYELDWIRVEHSTFAANAGAGGLCIDRNDLSNTDAWRLRLANNIFWDNSRDVRLRKRNSVGSIDVVASHNLFGNGIDANLPLSSAPVATLTGNPQFTNPALDDWRPGGASPAINTGRLDANLLALKDFAGDTRWYGSAPDRGAFESAIGSTATVLTVTNTSDSGIGSLRQALIDANAAPDFNRIRFAIGSTCGPRVITLASLLPTIQHPVAIDGYTQPGASRNTAVLGNNAVLCVALNGANQITGAYGLNVATDASADATVSIEGLAFGGHSIAAVQFAGGRDHRLQGVQLGGSIGAVDLLPNATGVRVAGATQGVRIGGPEPGQRNVVVESSGIGINIAGSGSTQPGFTVVENNYVGTVTGGDLRPNQRGILVRGADSRIVGNVVSNSGSHGIEVNGAPAVRNRLEQNRIGIPALCAGSCSNRGNGGHGVLVSGGANGTRIEANHSAFNGGDGVAVTGSSAVTIRRNRFHDNTGLGIDLDDDGIDFFNSNNTQPDPSQANGGQNKPLLTAAEGTADTGLASGTLNSANGWYRIDFYAAPSCQPASIGGLPLGNWGEAQDWLGSTFVQITSGTAQADGSASFSDALLAAPAGSSGYFNSPRQIMATATRLSDRPIALPGFEPMGFSHLGTSELGRCRTYQRVTDDTLLSDGFEDL